MFRATARLLSAAPSVRLPNTGAMINNTWRAGSAKFDTFNPANEHFIASVTESGPVEVEAAYQAAHNAFYGGEYSKMGGYARGRMLNR